MDNLENLLNDLKDSVANTAIPSYSNNFRNSGNDFDKNLQTRQHLKNKDNLSNLSFHESNSSLNNNNNSWNSGNNNTNNSYNKMTSNNTSTNNNTSNLSTNLCELDSLLEELSSAHFTGEVNKRSSGTSSQNISTKQDYDLVAPNQDPSGQCNDLDDLMSSLSSLNTKAHLDKAVDNQPNQPNNHYSNTSSTPNQCDSTPYTESVEDFNAYDNVAHQQQNTQDNDENLNAMMESLNKDLSLQGVQVKSRGSCAACGKLIAGQVITALGQLWHPEHFVCAKCKIEIGTENFFERDNVPYCEKDYHLLFSPKCAHCDCPILDKCVTALDRTWHPEHFSCYTCGRELGSEAFHERDGRIFCQYDYFQHFAPKCGTCGEAISDDFLTALNQQWHPKCFVCFECHQPFGTASFFEHEGYPYCSQHYHARKGSLCADCQQPISGRCITAMSLKFHPDHFRCTYCQRALTKGTFKEENNKPYCHRCFVSLFS